jgi:hypothetical protein
MDWLGPRALDAVARKHCTPIRPDLTSEPGAWVQMGRSLGGESGMGGAGVRKAEARTLRRVSCADEISELAIVLGQVPYRSHAGVLRPGAQAAQLRVRLLRRPYLVGQVRGHPGPASHEGTRGQEPRSLPRA